jgi:hypothetical protein
MDGLNLDPGLRHAYTKQTQQRLLAESTHARITKSVKNQKPARRELKQFSVGGKLRAIGRIIRDSSSAIVTVIRTSTGQAKA